MQNDIDMAARLIGGFLAIIATGAFAGCCGAVTAWVVQRRIERRERE